MILKHHTSAELREALKTARRDLGRMILSGKPADVNCLAASRLDWTHMHQIVSLAIQKTIADKERDWSVLPEQVWLKFDIEDLLGVIAYLLQRR